MAGEHWLRWHHGTVADPKWRVVAARAAKALSRDVTVGHVLSVWAAMLECASQASSRGELDNWDDEDIGVCLGISTAEVMAIREAMQGKTLDGCSLTGWNKRQIKSEDPTAAERKRAQRDREKASVTKRDIVDCHGASRSVTTEERREEEKEAKAQSSLRSDSPSAGADGMPTASEAEQEPKPLDAKTQRLRQVTIDAITAFNAKLGKPNGLLAAVSLTIGLDKRQAQVRRCLRLAAQICKQQYGDPRVTPEFWAAYFDEVDCDPFKSGRGEPGRGHERWLPTFEYLTREKTMLEVFDAAVSGAIA